MWWKSCALNRTRQVEYDDGDIEWEIFGADVLVLTSLTRSPPLLPKLRSPLQSSDVLPSQTAVTLEQTDQTSETSERVGASPGDGLGSSALDAYDCKDVDIPGDISEPFGLCDIQVHSTFPGGLPCPETLPSGAESWQTEFLKRAHSDLAIHLRHRMLQTSKQSEPAIISPISLNHLIKSQSSEVL